MPNKEFEPVKGVCKLLKPEKPPKNQKIVSFILKKYMCRHGNTDYVVCFFS